MKRLLIVSHTSLRSDFQIGAHHLYEQWCSMPEVEVCWISPPVTMWGCRKRDEFGTLTPRNIIPIRGSGFLVAASEFINGVFHAFEIAMRFNLQERMIVVDNPTYIPAFFLLGVPSEWMCLRLTDWLPRQVVEKKIFATDLWLRLAATFSSQWVVTSETLSRLVSLRYGKSAIVLENGVGPEIIAKQGDVMPVEPSDRRSRVIYYGAFDRRFDLQLVNRLAELIEPMHFDLYGPHAPSGVLHPRVRYQGYLPYSEISATLVRYEFGLLPFTREIMNQCRFPMKLWEMLACGLQVVAPPIGSLRRFTKTTGAAVWVARSWSAESLADCFLTASLIPRKTNSEEIESQSWSNKAAELLNILKRPSQVVV